MSGHSSPEPSRGRGSRGRGRRRSYRDTPSPDPNSVSSQSSPSVSHMLFRLLLYILSHRTYMLSFRCLSSNNHSLLCHILWVILQSHLHPTHLRLHHILSPILGLLFIPQEVHIHTHLCRHHMHILRHLFLRRMLTRLHLSQLIPTELITE